MTATITKRSASRLRLGLSVVLVVGFCLAMLIKPAPANAGTMRWTVVDTPNSTGNVIVGPSEINAIAIGGDGRTFYAVDIPNSRVYKSTDSSISWVDLVSQLTAAGAVLPAWDVAVAPDNPSLVAVVTSNAAGRPREVFVSNNEGAKWQNTNLDAALTANGDAGFVGAIDISVNYGSYDIAVGSRTGAGGGDVYVLKAVGHGTWAAQGFTGDILAAEFSPTYATDCSLVTISADASGTYINLGIHDIPANTTNWGTWGPVEVTTAGPGSSPNTGTPILTADLELPFDFSGQAPSLRRCYISIDAPTTNAGIYRFDDTVGYWLIPAAANKRISSIAYHGTYTSGKLLAGEVLGDTNLAAVITWFTDAPMTCPNTCWYQTQKAPTGGGNSGYANAQVAWSPDGSRAYCGTSSANLDVGGWPGGYLTGQLLDESAFSLTLDDGYTWNQLSLIDTEISFLSDVAPSASSETLYLASVNTHAGLNNFDSVWRSTSYSPSRTWERVLCMLTTTDDTILRMSPAEPDQSVFFGVRFTSDLLHSPNMGQTWHNTLPGVNITDFAVARSGDSMHIYVLDGNSVRKGESTNHTWRWRSKANTGLTSGHTIATISPAVVLVGDAAQGMVACCVDGGAQFTLLPAVPVPGNIHVIADARIQNYLVIYAASDGAGGQIYCWVAGASPRWTSMAPPGQTFYGLAQAGTLYGAWSTGPNTTVDRTLNPEAMGPPVIEWDSMTTGLTPGVIFTREPSSLKVSGNVDIWAIDNRAYTATTGRLWVFSDCLTMGPTPVSPSPELLFKAPWPTSPAMDAVVPTDPDTGEIVDINFKWQHLTPAKKYDLWLAKDQEFSHLVTQQSITPANPLAPNWTLSPATIPLEAGENYYWKVRVSRTATGETGDGKWSQVMAFSVASSLPEETPHPGPTMLTPANDATNVEPSPSFSWSALPGATEYEFTLAKDEALEEIVTSVKVPTTTYDYDGELDRGTIYFWQVKATKPFFSEPSPVLAFTMAVEEEIKAPSWMANLPLWVWIMIASFAAASIAASITAFIITRKKGSRAS